MKKFLAILLAAMMLFSCTALAEKVVFPEGSGAFDIFVEVGDDVSVLQFTSNGLPITHFQKKDSGAHVFVTIIASEQFLGNMSDLSDEDREALIADWALDCSDTVQITTETTPKGNMYVHFHTADNTDVEQIYTLYAGYIVNFVLYPDGGAELIEADHDFMMQLFYDLEFLPIAE